ncbi:MAG: PAS domain-containing protein, partial [Thermodesulfobacteriota bacterium]
MHDEDKTKEELISELRELRQQLEAQLAFSHSDKVNSALKRNQLSSALRQSRKDLIKSQSKTAASNKALTEFREALHTSEQNLANAHERYNILSDLVPFGVWTADAQGKITFLSDAFLEMSGIKTEDIANLEWVDQLSRPVVLSAVSDWSSESDKRDIWESEFWITSQTGRQYCILIRGVPMLDKQGKTLSWLGINLDISERKRAEKKLRCNNDELERLVQQRTSELARSYQAQSDFVANIS